MGKNRLKQKMRQKLAVAHERKRQPRDSYDVILIVCEGEKTEPHYLNALRNSLRLSSANIRICGEECGSAPISVVNFALGEFRSSKGVYDKIYCVFDKDKHHSYDEAIAKISYVKLPGGSTIQAITSIPCFEFWILLHFTFTTRPFICAGSDSNCAMVVKELKKYIADYSKGNNVFDFIVNYTDDAINRAKKLEEFHQTSGVDNPSTKIHQLVEYLQNMKQQGNQGNDAN